MKIHTVLMTLLLCATVTAYEMLLELPPFQESSEQAFYFDFDEIKPDSQTMRLTTTDGKQVPFSFDFTYGDKPHPGDLIIKDGCLRGRRYGPLALNSFQRAGIVSFKHISGIKSYRLSFRTGAKTILAKTNPAARAWWVELMIDPTMQTKEAVRPTWDSKDPRIPGIGLRVKKYNCIYPSSFQNVDERLYHRDLVGRVILHAPDTSIGIGFCTPWHTLHTGFKLPAGETIAVYLIGTVKTDRKILKDYMKKNVEVRNRMEFCGNKDKIFYVRRFNIQSPPDPAGIYLECHTSGMLKQGEQITFTAYNLTREVFQPRNFSDQKGRIITGARAENWTGKTMTNVILRDAKGNVIQSENGLKLKLKNISPGYYDVTATVHSTHQDILAQKTVRITVPQNPSW